MNTLETLKKAQRALLLAEVGALLHNLGKVTSQFFEWQLITDEKSPYRYQHILRLIVADYPPLADHFLNLKRALDDPVNTAILQPDTSNSLISTKFILPAPFDDREYRVGDLVEYLGLGKKEIGNTLYKKANGDYWIERMFPQGARLLHLLNRSHDAASGGEKEDIGSGDQGQQSISSLWLATPMGYEISAPGLNQIDKLKQEVEKTIQTYLKNRQKPFPIRAFAKELRNHLQQAMADTRRPLNDVTVWDIGSTGAAFLLTAVVAHILAGTKLEHEDLAGREACNKLFWRVLSCRLDGLGHLQQAATMAEVRVRRRMLTEALDAVRDYLADIPFAAELYRDENGSLFLFPDLSEDSPVFQEIKRNLENKLLLDGIQLALGLSEQLSGHPRDQDSAPYIGTYVQNVLKEKPLSQSYLPAFAGWDEYVADVCTACGVRPQGYGAHLVKKYQGNTRYYKNKARQRNICCVCIDRRRGVAEQWCSNPAGTTIWTDEATDANGRSALIVGKLDLDSFLLSLQYPSDIGYRIEAEPRFFQGEPADGTVFDLKNLGTFEWNVRQRRMIGLDGAKLPDRLNRTDIHIRSPQLPGGGQRFEAEDVCLDATGNYQLLLTTDLPTTLKRQEQCYVWRETFTVVNSRTLQPTTQEGVDRLIRYCLHGGDTTTPFLVIQAAKVPKVGSGATSQSFARQRRVWETTQEFWREALSLEGDSGHPILPENLGRLAIFGELRPRQADDKPGDYHTFELVFERTSLSVVWDSKHLCFVTADNLAWLERSVGQDLREWLPGKKFTVEEPVGYGGKNKVWGQLTVERVEEIKDDEGRLINYTPAISILAEPRTFMVLVPADRALALAAAIKREYQRQVGKVRGRLPLHLGLVYCDRRTPLRAVLDAGRRMLQMPSEQVLWMLDQDVQRISDNHELRFDNGQTWAIPARMGDGCNDLWYPYFPVETGGDSQVRDSALAFQGVRPLVDGSTVPCWFVHARDLCKGDQIWVTPSLFDFVYLDVTGRRFEVAYQQTNDEGKPERLDPHQRRKPYYLEQLDDLAKLWDLLRKSLTTKQINDMLGLNETKRREWQEDSVAFKTFVEDTLKNAAWRGGWDEVKDKQKLIQAAQSGMLDDVRELYMVVMKQKPEADQLTAATA